MIKVTHRTMIILSGLTWLFVGIFLLYLGIHFILSTIHNPFLTLDQGHFSIVAKLAPLNENLQQTSLLLVTACLFIGYLKGRFVLAKAAKRQISRIASFPNPTSITNLYSRGYFLLIAVMIGLGILLRFLPITLDTRGAVDLAIGAALINGSLHYFRFATTSYTSTMNQTSE